MNITGLAEKHADKQSPSHVVWKLLFITCGYCNTCSPSGDRETPVKIVMGWIVCPWIPILKSLPPVLQNVNLFDDSIFTEVIKLKRGH